MSTFYPSTFTTRSTEQQWLDHLKYAGYQLDSGERAALLAHNDSQQTQLAITSLRETTSAVSSELAAGLGGLSESVESLADHMDVMQEAMASGLRDLESAFSRGLNQVDDTLRRGFVGLAKQLDTVHARMDYWGAQFDSNQRLQLQGQRLNNIINQNIAELLRIPDSQKQRQYHIEEGFKHFKNASLDSAFFKDAIAEFTNAYKMKDNDYTVLFHLGLIHLYVKEYFDAAKAQTYFATAGRYAAVESDPAAFRIFNILTADYSKEKQDQPVNLDAIKQTAGEAYFLSSQAAWIQGKLDEALELGEKALTLMPAFKPYTYWKARLLCQTKQAPKAVALLKPLIESDPSFSVRAAVEPELIIHGEVKNLLNDLNTTANQWVSEVIAKADALLEPQSHALELLNQVKALRAKNSYLDALEAKKLIEAKSFKYENEQFTLLEYLAWEKPWLGDNRIIYKLTSDLLGISDWISDRATDVQKKLLALLEGPVEDVIHAAIIFKIKFTTPAGQKTLKEIVDWERDLHNERPQLQQKLDNLISQCLNDGVVKPVLVDIKQAVNDSEPLENTNWADCLLKAMDCKIQHPMPVYDKDCSIQTCETPISFISLESLVEEEKRIKQNIIDEKARLEKLFDDKIATYKGGASKHNTFSSIAGVLNGLLKIVPFAGIGFAIWVIVDALRTSKGFFDLVVNIIIAPIALVIIYFLTKFLHWLVGELAYSSSQVGRGDAYAHDTFTKHKEWLAGFEVANIEKQFKFLSRNADMMKKPVFNFVEQVNQVSCDKVSIVANAPQAKTSGKQAELAMLRNIMQKKEENAAPTDAPKARKVENYNKIIEIILSKELSTARIDMRNKYSLDVGFMAKVLNPTLSKWLKDEIDIEDFVSFIIESNIQFDTSRFTFWDLIIEYLTMHLTPIAHLMDEKPEDVINKVLEIKRTGVGSTKRISSGTSGSAGVGYGLNLI